MAPRACLPGEFFLDAAIIDARRQIEIWRSQKAHREDWATLQPPSDGDIASAGRPPFIALRWVLSAGLGIPLEPFTVWRRPASKREPPAPIANWRALGATSFVWDGVTEMMRIELDVADAVTAVGLTTRSAPVATASSAGAGTLVLQGGPMLAVRLSNPVAVTGARGLSAIAMANGAGWRPIERVGLPIEPDQLNGVYYNSDGQGPQGAPMSARDAAIDRLKKWGPRLGWAPLAGLPPWRAPDPWGLVEEFEQDLRGALIEVMNRRPPPDLDRQALEEIVVRLPRLRQINGPARGLNSAVTSDRSQARVRPLQAVTAAVASDAWASLTLGFGTGADIGEIRGGLDDFMVTAPWKGMLRIIPPGATAFPFLNLPEPPEVAVEIDRDLAAIVLSPLARREPAAPSPLVAQVAFAEGAPSLDAPYRMAAMVTTDARASLPGRPRTAAYALARYDAPGKGGYAMRAHPKAGGWLPLAAALPIPAPLKSPDPALPPGKSVLRESGLPAPISGPPQLHQYAAAAVDLFGQWGPWSTAWLSLGAADVQSPGVAAVRTKAIAGPAGEDPCSLTVTVDLTWDWRERRCAEMSLAVDVYDPAPPPLSIGEPALSPTPGWTVVTISILFDADGAPSTAAPGVTVHAVSEDGNTVYPGAHPAGVIARTFRATLSSVPVTFGQKLEKAVATYARAIEVVRPGEWSAWGYSREAAIAPNPIPPKTPAPLPAVYPNWASLPDPAGFSSAPVVWTPSGAPGYRVYLATETALLAACGMPGPRLTDGYGDRMQALFDLYKTADNLPKLRSAYRKVDEQTLNPPLADGVMRHEVALPRGSKLIHCFIVVGVTPANVVSSWPTPDADGRRAFIPFAIPAPLRTNEPEVVVTLDDAGVPIAVVRIGGATAPRKINLYRSSDARLARSVGTMDLAAAVTPDPAHWSQTIIPDVTAPTGWRRLHYRASALAADDPDHAHMALPATSRGAFALLRPPPDAPAINLVANAPGSTASVALVSLVTDAPQATTDVGDHVLSLVVEVDGAAPDRFSAPLAGLRVFDTMADLLAASDPAAYVMQGGAPHLFLRRERPPAGDLAITVDLVDPLQRSRRVNIVVPIPAAPPAPVISAFTLRRAGGVLIGRLVTNAPGHPDPAQRWTLSLSARRAGFPPRPSQTRSFDIATIPEIAGPAQLPNPSTSAAAFVIARVAGSGQILFWSRVTVATRIVANLANPAGQSAVATQVSL